MPVGRRYDYMLGGKGFMLVRNQYKGRAWTRTGASDAPSRRSDADTKYGMLADEIDHPEVWDDWSGGYGQPYRRAGENTYHWAENFDARFPRQLVHCQQLMRVTATMATGGYSVNLKNVGVEQFADRPLYGDDMGNGKGAVIAITQATVNNFHYMPVSSASIEAIAPVWPGAKGRPALFGSFWYVGGVSLQMQWVWDYSSGHSGEANSKAHGFVRVGNRLWKHHNTYVQNCAVSESTASTPMGPTLLANWSATINIGTHHNLIHDVRALDDQLVVGTKDGVYLGDQTGTFVNVMEGLNPIHEDNFRDLLVADGQLYVQHATGVYRYYSNGYAAVINQIGPPTAHRAPVQGRVRCLARLADWKYAGLFTGSQSYLLAFQETASGVKWHTLHRLPHTVSIHRIHFDAITRTSAGDPICTRAWIATDASAPPTGTACFYYMPIPDLNGNPLMPSPYFSANYIGSARMDLGAVDWGAPGTPKVYRAVEVWADNLASGAQWAKLYYSIDNEATRHLLGTTAKSPKDVLYFPSGEGSFVTGQSIALSMESFTASAGVTPIYRAIVLRGALRPNSIDQITAVTRIADNVMDRQGSLIPRSGATMLAELRAMAQSGSPVQLVDLAGATQYVSVLAPISEQETYQLGSDEPEIAATVKMSVLAYS
jgi:hypothetical protein